jgi:hypothetical protein
MTMDRVSSIKLTEAEIACVTAVKKKLTLLTLMIFLPPLVSLIISAVYVRLGDVCCLTTTHLLMQSIDITAPGIAEFIKQEIKWQNSFSGVYWLVGWNVSLIAAILMLPISFYAIKDIDLEYFIYNSHIKGKDLVRSVGHSIMIGLTLLAFGLFLIFITHEVDYSTLGKKNKFNDQKLGVLAPIYFQAVEVLFAFAIVGFKKAFLLYKDNRFK